MNSDAELMLKARQGDQAAFNQLVIRFQSALVNFFYKLIWDRCEAEDFAQEVFVKVYLARASYQDKSKFSTYLFRIATNYWIDYLRTKGKHRKPVSLDKEIGQGEDTNQLANMITSGQLTPEEIVLRREQMARTRQAIDSLPEEQKIVFILSETQGMKYQEIAETLDVPLGTVKSRIHAAVLKLRAVLTAKGVV
ncbi:RNA polymerase sigma factor [Planctomycetota bacterium]